MGRESRPAGAISNDLGGYHLQGWQRDNEIELDMDKHWKNGGKIMFHHHHHLTNYWKMVMEKKTVANV